MTKVHLLGANKSYDRSVQTVSVNQVVVLEGYSYDSYVVYEVTRDKWGITYHLVNWKIQCKLPPKTKRFCPLVLK